MASFWLEFTQDGQRREFSFDAGSVTIGRDKAADFVLDHPTVSRQHAMIRADHHGAQLVVLSRGGLTALDGGQVQGEVPLYDGSEIHFGQLSFTFRSHAAPPRPAGAAGASSSFGAMPIPAPQTNGSAMPMNNVQSNNGAGASSNSNDWNASSGSWGNQDWDAPSSPEPAAPKREGDLVTWDQIANSAEARDEQESDRLTDFQKIQAAQAKADKQTRGNSPWIVYGGVIGILAMVVIAVWPFGGKKAPTTTAESKLEEGEAPFIAWASNDIDCVGQANCREAALSAYKVGKNLVEQSGADITNPYEAYANFDKAQLYLEKGKIDPVPAEMANVTDLQLKVRVDLDAKFNQARVNYHNFEKRKMYRKMADELNRLQAYFPDKRCLYNQWAVEKERKMKDDRVYPVTTAVY